jgi:hypothetical protein
MFMAILMSFGSWLLAMGKRCAKSALGTSRGILTRIFLREQGPVWSLPVGKSSRSIAFLKHLGRLRRREGRIACDLGSLAKAVHRQGLQEHARHLSRSAFEHWRRCRVADQRIRRVADDAVRNQAR